MGALTALVVASSALSAGSSVLSARGQRRAAGEAVKEGNRLADDALARGREESAAYRIKLDQVLGRQRAVYGASGLDPTLGSAKQVQAQTTTFGETDLATIRENALREAYGLRRSGQQTARSLRAGATAAYGQAFGTVLSAGARGWELYSQGRTGMATTKAAVSSTKWGM